MEIQNETDRYSLVNNTKIIYLFNELLSPNYCASDQEYKAEYDTVPAPKSLQMQ